MAPFPHLEQTEMAPSKSFVSSEAVISGLSKNAHLYDNSNSFQSKMLYILKQLFDTLETNSLTLMTVLKFLLHFFRSKYGRK